MKELYMITWDTEELWEDDETEYTEAEIEKIVDNLPTYAWLEMNGWTDYEGYKDLLTFQYECLCVDIQRINKKMFKNPEYDIVEVTSSLCEKGAEHIERKEMIKMKDKAKVK